jgi:hypothetical protein
VGSQEHNRSNHEHLFSHFNAFNSRQKSELLFRLVTKLIFALVATSVSRPNNLANTQTEPHLSRGRFSLPHRGDWTHEGQPALHGQLAIVSKVRFNNSSNRSNAASAKPAPPGKPS